MTRRGPKLPDRELTAAEYNDAVMLAKTEAEFQKWVIGTAVDYGWQREFIYHTRYAVGSEPGFPDLVLVRDRVIYWELKRESGVEKPKQKRWIAALKAAGQEADFRYPHDWREIVDTLSLNDWGRLVSAAFDSTPYLVGSAARGKQWRDVDVRLILDDEEFFARFPNGAYGDRDERWSAVCWAWATFGRDRTGLPIDFQIQAATHANGHYGGLERVPLGIYLGRPEGPP